MPGPHLTTLTAPDGTTFRDLDHDGVMAPFEDPRLSPGDRADDLTGRLSLAEKVGLMFHNIIEIGEGGALLEGDGPVSKMATAELVTGLHINHVNVHGMPDARTSAQWSNALQALAATAPHSIPVTVSTDPRHGFVENSGMSFMAGAMSEWPEPLGLAALGDPERVREFADTVRQEYLAVGIRSALHPQIDLASDPRWARQVHTFGTDPEFVADVAEAYIAGLQGGPDLGPTSVAAMAKHFPGGGPQRDGEDPHFPYGADQVYPGERFEDHLVPFRRAIACGVSALMPYYGKPVDLVVDGEPVEEVAFGFNQQMLTGLLRERLGYDGVICTDWGLVTGDAMFNTVVPTRSHGAEHLTAFERVVKVINAGADQFGGESVPDLVILAVEEGLISVERIDESVKRLLKVKFQLGLFDDPFVDEDEAERIVGNAAFRGRGRLAQAESMVVLVNDGVLPLAPDLQVYVEGIAADEASALGTMVDDPHAADVAIVRLPAPFDPRSDYYLEPFFHAGSLEYRPGRVWHLHELSKIAPLVLVANLERPGLLAPFGFASAIIGEFGASPEAICDVLTGASTPSGRLPFEIPISMEAVRNSRPDVPNDTENPLFPVGFGLDYAVKPSGEA